MIKNAHQSLSCHTGRGRIRAPSGRGDLFGWINRFHLAINRATGFQVHRTRFHVAADPATGLDHQRVCADVSDHRAFDMHMRDRHVPRDLPAYQHGGFVSLPFKGAGLLPFHQEGTRKRQVTSHACIRMEHMIKTRLRSKQHGNSQEHKGDQGYSRKGHRFKSCPKALCRGQSWATVPDFHATDSRGPIVHVINFFGAPGAGKSTAALGLAWQLKRRWVNAEYVPEFAKDLVWRDISHLLKHQLYVFAEQQLRLDCLEGKVDVAVCDSPLLLSSFYSPADYPLPFKQTVFEFFDLYSNINIVVRRTNEYVAKGRLQDEAESDRLAELMEQFLFETGVPYYVIHANDANPEHLVRWLVRSGIVKTANPNIQDDAEGEGADTWTPPERIQQLGANGLPKRNMAALARHYLDKNIRTVGTVEHHPSIRSTD